MRVVLVLSMVFFFIIMIYALQCEKKRGKFFHFRRDVAYSGYPYKISSDQKKEV